MASNSESTTQFDQSLFTLAQLECWSEEVCLPKTQVDCWFSFIYADKDVNAEPLSPKLQGPDDRLAAYNIQEMTFASQETVTYECNWKLILGNIRESYHLFCMRRNTLERTSPTRSIRTMNGGPGWNMHQLDHINKSVDRKSRSCADGVTTTGYIGAIYLAQPISFGSAASLLWIAITPVRVDRSNIAIRCIAHPNTGNDQASARPCEAS